MRNGLLIAVVSALTGCDPIDTFVKSDYIGNTSSVEAIDELIGSWKTTFVNDSTGLETTAVAIVTNGHFSDTWFNVEKKIFIGTFGGSWELKNSKIFLTFEFNTLDPTQVGKTISREFKVENDVITFLPENDKWLRVDDGSPGVLANAWLITGRKRNGVMNSFTSGVRKTMKILSGTRFQWIAYNTATKEFFGTGGGTYSTENGKYVENIEFFSRNADRIGASLEFEFELRNGDWEHKGFSSRGDPIHEIWTPRRNLDKMFGK